MTRSMTEALGETNRRREKQQAYNSAHGITPETIKRTITNILGSVYEADHLTVEMQDVPHLVGKSLKSHLTHLERRMRDAAANLEFEEAAKLRDEIRRLEAHDLGLGKV
eukprot:TRINITY_DN5140_c0_g1_i1.p3 TRINITY_DN5140_c0_g1~~TRINITY_DN5140_c0_g1_i1.p3  ORF type:complete len:109 (-),score=1.13 TRINITY_DN5140_c0_g1_i1:695-1021(-)